MMQAPAANRRPGVHGIHSVDHFRIDVPNLDVAASFYTRFGLEVRPAGTGFELYTFGNEHRWAIFGEAPQKKLAYVRFGAFAEDMPVFRARLRERGIAETPPAGTSGEGIWFRDPDGMLVSIEVAAKVSPDEKATVEHPLFGSNIAAMPLRDQAPVIRPRRLSHILVFTSDVARAIAFYRDVVGLALSDSAGDGIAFMHGVHGSDHHLIAFAKSDAPGFHHCSWDVPSVNAVGLGAMQMADAGFRAGWGLGRHVLGSNFFHYVRDPWGSYSEYSHDIDFISVDGRWKAGAHSPENGFYLWGPVPPDDFAFNYESPAASLTRELVASEP